MYIAHLSKFLYTFQPAVVTVQTVKCICQSKYKKMIIIIIIFIVLNSLNVIDIRYTELKNIHLLGAVHGSYGCTILWLKTKMFFIQPFEPFGNIAQKTNILYFPIKVKCLHFHLTWNCFVSIHYVTVGPFALLACLYFSL